MILFIRKNNMPNICHNHARFVFPSKLLYDKFIYAIHAGTWFAEFPSINSPYYRQIHPKLMNVIVGCDLECLLWTATNEAYDINVTNSHPNTKTIEMTFSTHRIPPIIIYRAMWESYGIEIDAKYYECGEAFFGKYVYNQYEFMDNIYDYPINLDQLRRRVGQDPEMDIFMTKEWVRYVDVRN